MNTDELVKKLQQLDHYNKYPVMTPFVGDFYEDPSHKRLLLIGESHYLPDLQQNPSGSAFLVRK